MIVHWSTLQGHHCCVTVTLHLGTALPKASQICLLQGYMTDKAPCQSHLFKNLTQSWHL